jgi:DNA-directed RNA polymerase subunit RPC12/RpoP
MSEFKFACPVCGQHITADSHAAGSQLECPTCFRKIIVPQGPSSTDPKFILSAAQANKPRRSTLPAPSTETGAPSASPSSISLVVTLAVAAVVGLGTAAFLYAMKSKTSGEQALNTTNEAEPAVVLGPTNKLVYSLDLTNMVYPDAIVSGRIRGKDFVCRQATLQGGTLTLRQGRSGNDPGVSIYFFAPQAELLRGRSAYVMTNQTAAPRVVMRWKEGIQNMSVSFNGDYALKVEFGEPGPGGMPGKIYLCLPDHTQSCIAGTFTAEIRKPAAPRQREQRPKRPN